MRYLKSISPLTFVCGLVTGFLYCRHLGAFYAQHSPFENMVRAPQAVNAASGCAPTIDQMVELAKTRTGQGKVIVVVGGNSVFLGSRQPLEQIWTRRLQEELGSAFEVFNFAQRGMGASGGAESVAEALWKQGIQVIYVANMSPPDLGPPDAGAPYARLFWNARARGWLFDWAPRDQYFARDASGAAKRAELKLRGQFDRFTYAEDLWNSVSYTRFSTVWDELASDRFLLPRSAFPDTEAPPPPAPQRFEQALAPGVALIGRVTAETHKDETLRDQIEAAFPPQVRSRSLIVVTGFCPYFVRRAPTDQQQRYFDIVEGAVTSFRAAGISSMEAGSRYEDELFGDIVHFMPPGGIRLAGEVAREVRRIAKEAYGIPAIL